MTIDFMCQKCEGEFELDSQDLIDGSEKIECPHCGAKASQAVTDDFTAAFVELNAQVAVLSKKFTLNFEIDSEEVGPEKSVDEAEESDDEEDDDFDDDDDDGDDDDDDLDDDDAVDEQEEP